MDHERAHKRGIKSGEKTSACLVSKQDIFLGRVTIYKKQLGGISKIYIPFSKKKNIDGFWTFSKLCTDKSTSVGVDTRHAERKALTTQVMDRNMDSAWKLEILEPLVTSMFALVALHSQL